MDESRPAVTVLMPVHNGESFISEAIDSILGQTFNDFEFLIIDDGSDDGSQDIIASYRDKRIRFERNENNLGLASTLNRGLEISSGKYIARMDCDDISLPERLKKEVDALENDGELVLLGSAYHVVDTNGRLIRTDTHPLNDTSIRWKLLFHNSFAHSSVMFRGDIIRSEKLVYSTEGARAQDYELWPRILEFGKGLNLEVPLIKYRIHTEQISKRYSEEQTAIANRISVANIEKLGIDVTEQEIESLRDWYNVPPRTLSEKDMELFNLLFTIISRFEKINEIDLVHIKAIRRQWVLRVIRASISRDLLRPATIRFFKKILFGEY